MQQYNSIPVTNVSLDTLEDIDASGSDYDQSESQIYSALIKTNLISTFTTRQRRVLHCLYEEGMSRKEAAKHLLVSEQAIHQIVGRMKSRVRLYGNNEIRNLVYFYLSLSPDCTPEIMQEIWYAHPVLRDYPRPDKQLLALWYRKFQESLQALIRKQIDAK